MPSTVMLAACPDYAAVPRALDALLAGLGGMGRFVKPGQSVLIKPNLLSDHAPEEAVTTHPEVVRALVRRVRAEGAHPWVADSPANATDLRRVWERTGIEALCREEAVPLVNLEKAGSVTFEDEGLRYTLARPVLEAHAVINVPKVKTHVLTGLTGAVKNLYGAVPGFQKTACHKRYPRPADFGRLLVAIHRRVRPALSVADGVVGMEGNGPSAGVPVPLGVLAGSADAVALDTVLCGLLGLNPEKVVHLALAARAGQGVADRAAIRIEGDGQSALAPRAYRRPSTVPLDYVPRWLVRLLDPYIWHRPALDDTCIACGKCVKACPVAALTLEQGWAKPRLTPARCIACCCCHEVCPVRAIEMRPSPLFRLAREFTRGRR
jgi:uncharacterized protein (DUF362 family)/Pyruvate/2-oxoacid:ferredoxin oxidoreductase delta subunit